MPLPCCTLWHVHTGNPAGCMSVDRMALWCPPNLGQLEASYQEHAHFNPTIIHPTHWLLEAKLLDRQVRLFPGHLERASATHLLRSRALGHLDNDKAKATRNTQTTTATVNIMRASFLVRAASKHDRMMQSVVATNSIRRDRFVKPKPTNE
jgi:hypothetical protein